MLGSVAFVLNFLAVLLLPGMAFCFLFNEQWIQRHRFLVSIAISYAVFTFLLAIGQLYSLGLGYLKYSILFVLLSSLIVVVIKSYRQSKKGQVFSTHEFFWPFLIAISVAIYHFIVGYYDEIPADIFAHVENFRKALDLQENHFVGESSFSHFFSKKSLIWYHFIAFNHLIANTSVESTLYLSTLLTKALFLIAVYTFSLRVFLQSPEKRLIALITTLFVALHMGISVFSYIRYYSFAPTILNFILYFAAIAIFLDILQNSKPLAEKLTQFILMGVFTVSAGAIHTQEALYICVMIGLIAVVASFARQNIISNPSRVLARCIVVIGCITFVVAFFLAQKYMQRAPNVGWRLWEFGTWASWLPPITTLNMKYQFIQVITLWGCLVYVGSLLFWREIRKNLFLFAGLISPAVTILNPFFVDLFLRADNSTTLWRLTYIVPIHFAGAFLVVKAIKGLRDTIRGNKTDFNCAQTTVAGIFLLLSVILILPIKNTFAGVHFSRFPTLVEVQTENSPEGLQDLIDELRGLEKRYQILTDPVTGYVISGFTQHHSRRVKFFPIRFAQFTFDDYSNSPLAKHKGKLLIINTRNSQQISNVGKLGRHWSATILNQTKYYPDNLLHHLQTKPNQFQLMWKALDSKVMLYKILD